MANKTVIAAKEEEVKKLATKMKEEKLILLVNYTGTTVEDDTKLRKDLREANAASTVVKNNIIKRALDANGESGLDDVLSGPTAIVSSVEDYVAPLKVAYKFSKDHENYTIKGGIIDGKVMSVEELKTLAQLPSREELLAKLAGSLLGTISKLAVAVDQVRIKKESEGEAAPAAVEATPAQA